MGAIGDKAEKALEDKIYNEGGYPAWLKYKAGRLYKTVTACECCK